MKIIIFNYSAFFLILLATFSCCKSEESVEPTGQEKFCSYLNAENIDKTIPVVNDFLSGLPEGADAIRELEAWLKSCLCIVDVKVVNDNHIGLSFYEKGATKYLFMNISTNKPVKLDGYSEYIDIPIQHWPYHFNCQWTNMGYDGKVIVINSVEELKKYTLCPNDVQFKSLYNAIDFSKHSLLLTSGVVDDGISFYLSQTLTQFTENQYKLNIEMLLSKTISGLQWIRAMITDKISENSNIELKIKTIYEDERKEVAFTELNLLYTYCWKYILHGTSPDGFYLSPVQNELIVINSIEEMDNYYGCRKDYSPDVDFTKYSLIYASFKAISAPVIIDNMSFIKTSSKGYYEFIVEYLLGYIQFSEFYKIFIITEKLPPDVKINFISNKIN